ncbi:hypothetical protein [Lysinibacillus xylanilyticus]|uniref:hypothetical protein n=1 Tax=Lysinibacillus xylanilyticus TaxID=582475 RepID=UPI003D0576F5
MDDICLDLCLVYKLIGVETGRPQEALLCAKAKRQRQMFYLCESEASAARRPVGTEINHTLW